MTLQLELFLDPPRAMPWEDVRVPNRDLGACGIAAEQIYGKPTFDVPFYLWPPRCGVCQKHTECFELFYCAPEAPSPH